MQPLKGIRVIEFCTVATGPFCAMLVTDMGADVIKVEHPEGGDSKRQWPPLSGGFSENFTAVNGNRRSVSLDLKDPSYNAKARELAAGADVVVENNRPGVMARLGLDYSSLSALSPALVYCSISAFGQGGPRAAEAGFDLTVQAMSGVISGTGERGGAPVKCGVPISEFTTGLYAAFAIAAKLREVTSSGKSAHIDASMFGATLAVGALQTSQYFGSGIDPEKLGSAHPRNEAYQAFQTADGYVAMAAGNNALFRSACAAIDRDDLVELDRFSSTASRAQHQVELKEIVEKIFCPVKSDEVLIMFRKAGVPCSPINTYSQALADVQVEHMQWVQR